MIENEFKKTCLFCKNSFYVIASRINKAKYCSRECSGLASKGIGRRKGIKNKNRKEVLDDNGYILVFLPTHPLARKDGYVTKHRMIYYDKTGIKLSPNLHIHHKNENKKDNRFENLEVLDIISHAKHHYKGYFGKKRKIQKCRMCNLKIKSDRQLCPRHYQTLWARAKRKGVPFYQFFDEQGLI